MPEAMPRSSKRRQMKYAARPQRIYRPGPTGPCHRSPSPAAQAPDALFAITAHDMVNALTVITAFTELLQQHLRAAAVIDPERVVQGLEQIAAAAQRLQEQVAALAHISELAPDQHTSPRRTVDLVTLVSALAACYREIAEQHQIDVVVLAQELVGDWDVTGLERMISNLLSNAIKYSPGGGDIILTLAREDLADSAFAVLAVQDHGIGIPSDDLPEIFDPFRRAGNVGQIPGMGLGLASARQIVAQHGGTIAATSTTGGGATVTVRLPLKRYAANVSTSRHLSKEQRLQSNAQTPSCASN